MIAGNLFAFSYLPLPIDGGAMRTGGSDNLMVAPQNSFIPGGGGKPSGSLPDLTNFHVNSQSPTTPSHGAAARPEMAGGADGYVMPIMSPNYVMVRQQTSLTHVYHHICLNRIM